MPPKIPKEKLKCFTRTTKEGNKYVNCQDKTKMKGAKKEPAKKAPVKRKINLVKKAEPPKKAPVKRKINLVKKAEPVAPLQPVKQVTPPPPPKPSMTKYKPQEIPAFKPKPRMELPDDVLKQVKEFAKPTGSIKTIQLINVDRALLHSSLKGSQIPQADVVFERFKNAVKKEGGDIKNIKLINGSIVYKGKPRIEKVNLSNTKTQKIDAVFEFPVNSYGGTIYFEITDKKNNPPYTRTVDEYNSRRMKIPNQKKLEKFKNKFRAEGWRDYDYEFTPAMYNYFYPRSNLRADKKSLDIPLFYLNPKKYTLKDGTADILSDKYK